MTFKKIKNKKKTKLFFSAFSWFKTKNVSEFKELFLSPVFLHFQRILGDFFHQLTTGFFAETKLLFKCSFSFWKRKNAKGIIRKASIIPL